MARKLPDDTRDQKGVTTVHWETVKCMVQIWLCEVVSLTVRKAYEERIKYNVRGAYSTHCMWKRNKQQKGWRERNTSIIACLIIFLFSTEKLICKQT